MTAQDFEMADLSIVLINSVAVSSTIRNTWLVTSLPRHLSQLQHSL